MSGQRVLRTYRSICPDEGSRGHFILSEGESLPGDLSDLNFANPEFSDSVQADELCRHLNLLLVAAIDSTYVHAKIAGTQY